MQIEYGVQVERRWLVNLLIGIENPQYTTFAIRGLGLVLVWPRFTLLIMYVTMLFVYDLLPRKKEVGCEEKFGDAFRAYVEKIQMLVSWGISVGDSLPSLPKAGFKRVAAGLLVFFEVLGVSVLAGFWVREIIRTPRFNVLCREFGHNSNGADGRRGD